MRTLASALLVGLVATVLVVAATAAPQPSEVPVSWELEFDHQMLAPISVQLPGQDKPRIFWYMRYRVTNRTGSDVVFVPELVLYTDSGQVIRAGQKVPAAVFDEIRKLYNDPLLNDAPAMTGKLLQGEDNAKDGVAIWPDFDSQSGMVDIFVGGLSGETREVKLPTPVKVTETDARGRVRTVTKDKIVLTKTQQLRFSVPGEAAARLNAPVSLSQTKWVMR